MPMNRLLSLGWSAALSGLLLATAATSASAAGSIRPAPLRIMLIGDSITEGSEGGYRAPLFQKISRSIGMPNFVGRRNSRATDPAGLPDNDHEGYSAYRIDEIASGEGFWGAPPIETRLSDWEPAVVTLHAGTNDAQQNYHFQGDAALGIPSAIDRLDNLVSRIVAHNPAIHILVAQIIPANAPASPRTITYVERLNAQIPAMVAAHQAAGHRVSLVDMYTPMRAYPNPDGIHPSAEGSAVMAEVWFRGLKALGVLPGNPDPGRDDGLVQEDRWSPNSTTPWTLTPNLIRAGSATLASVQSSGYGGSQPLSVLNDGLQDRFTDDPNNTHISTFTLNTSVNSAGYDLQEVRSMAGQVPAANGDERIHQAYELWWSSVDAPENFSRLGDFHHIMVNRDERASQISIRRADGQPLARRVKQLQFRFVEPPLRQWGFYGVENPTRYRELEALGQPSR